MMKAKRQPKIFFVDRPVLTLSPITGVSSCNPKNAPKHPLINVLGEEVWWIGGEKLPNSYFARLAQGEYSLLRVFGGSQCWSDWQRAVLEGVNFGLSVIDCTLPQTACYKFLRRENLLQRQIIAIDCAALAT